MAFLSRITMKGFKTFARPTELVFEQGVSVIIGPNGSGKSNIADAVLWALGEQSPTSMRGRSMQDVIFSGSDGHRPAAGAEVKLVFDNSSGVFPLDYQEVEIARRVSRDGSSEYRINGALSRLLDVEDLVAGVGLGREMHSVISQGKVDEIVNSSPAARRALLEEAAGLGRYKKRRDRALAKLEKVKANLLRVSDVEREVRAALRPLKQQVSAAERHAEATEDLARLRALVAMYHLVELERRMARESEALHGVKARKAEAEELLTGLRQERMREEERFAAALREREALSAAYHQAAADLDRIRTRASSLQQRTFRVESDLARASRRAALAVEEDEAARGRLVSLESGPGGSARRLALVTGIAERLAERLEAVRPESEAAAAREEACKEEVFSLETERARALQEKGYLTREMEGRARRAEELGERARVAGERLAEIDRGAAERQAAVTEAERGLGRLEAILVEARERAAAAAAAVARTGEDERRVKADLEEVTARTAILADVASRREGTPQAARELLGRSKGAVLVVEALSVTSGYERAVAAALGPLASAVVLGGATEPDVLRAAAGPLEIVWPEGAGPDAGASAARTPEPVTGPAPGLDLWEVVTGPPALLAALRAIVPPTWVTEADHAPLPDMGARVVTRGGEVWHGSVHAAQRGEAATEMLLSARTELETLGEREGLLRSALIAAQAASQRAVQDSAQAQAEVAASEERAREARTDLAARFDEVQLWGRRRDEAEAEAIEADERVARDIELARELEEGLREVEDRSHRAAVALDGVRAELRSIRERGEVLRAEVTGLESKRSQAAVLAVRLRERDRARGEELDRARVQADRAARVVEQTRRRERALEEYLPTVKALGEVTASLLSILESGLEGLSGRLDVSRAATDDFGDALKDQGRRESDLQRIGSELNEDLVRLEVALAHLQEQAAERERELEELRRRHQSPRGIDAGAVDGVEVDELERAVERAERKRERIGPVNPLAEQEYRETEERARFLGEQRADLEASLAELRSVIRDLDQHIETTFNEVFEATRTHFEEMVKILFPGGKGVLRLTEGENHTGNIADPSDEEEGGADEEERLSAPGPGLVLEIKPPRKAPRNMTLLSGGEKALTAIAFLFGLFLARPCPFYVLDEVEAALDDLNLGRFLSLVRRYQQRTQFIVITHQRRTMEIADRLYGVAMDGDGTSRVLSRRLGEAGLPVNPAPSQA